MRITNQIRSSIRNALLAHAYGDREAALKKRENELALKLYRTRVPAAFEKQMDKIDERGADLDFKDSFFDRISTIRIDRPGVCNRDVNLAHRRPWTSNYKPTMKIADDHELAGEIDAYAADLTALENDRGKSKAEIDATLKPIFTADKLRKAWPECMSIAEPVLREAGMQPKPTLMTIETDSLNAALGLPADLEKELEAA